MQRACFIALGSNMTVSLTAAAHRSKRSGAAPKPSASPVPSIETTIDRIPGTTGIWATKFDTSAPIASYNASEPFAAASIIKLAIMATAFRALDAGDVKLDKPIRFHPGDIIGGSSVFGNVNSTMRAPLRDLLAAMIRQSDNTASNALISAFGFRLINANIRDMGLTNTTLARHFADVVPAGRINLNVTTPHDVGVLLAAIERGAREGLHTIASASACRAMIDILLGQEDRTKIAAGLSKDRKIANKTGEIDGVRNDAAIVDPYGDVPYVLVVLTKNLVDTELGERGIAAIAARIDQLAR